MTIREPVRTVRHSRWDNPHLATLSWKFLEYASGLTPAGDIVGSAKRHRDLQPRMLVLRKDHSLLEAQTHPCLGSPHDAAMVAG